MQVLNAKMSPIQQLAIFKKKKKIIYQMGKVKTEN